MTDPFEELELSPNASAEVIQAAYRRLARKHHPDSGEDPDADRMVRINKAFAAIAHGRETRPRGTTRAKTGAPRVAQLLSDAEDAADAGDWRTVRRLAGQVLQFSPRDIDSQLLLAEAAVAEQDWSEAARASSRVLAAEPDNRDALLYGAERLLGTRDLLGARGLAATVLVVDPEDADARELWAAANDALR
ncbi:MAG: DnaJ domain-containing protein [Chloroflexi bacterium]|nr:DnaJ domain-containing protein [Chloroflexota bacterium]MDA1003124.1 DnaJ domain-containing protein [Chloroflexota bacterium]